VIELQHDFHLQHEVDTLKMKIEEIEEAMVKTQEIVRKAQQEMEKFKNQEVSDLFL
jgi:peptidoglycan hydrolase CwlO-like protein